MSKLADVTDDLIAGYSLPHCDGFRTLLLRSESSVACTAGFDKRVKSPAGE